MRQNCWNIVRPLNGLLSGLDPVISSPSLSRSGLMPDLGLQSLHGRRNRGGGDLPSRSIVWAARKRMRATTGTASVRFAAGVSEPALACIVELTFVAVELGDLSPELLSFTCSFTLSFSFTSSSSAAFGRLWRGRRFLVRRGLELLDLLLELEPLFLAVRDLCWCCRPPDQDRRPSSLPLGLCRATQF